MLHMRADKYERNFRRAAFGDDEYYYLAPDRDEGDEYEEDEFV